MVSQVKQYMRRAEELKALLKTAATDSQSATSTRSTELGGELVTLVSFCHAHVGLVQQTGVLEVGVMSYSGNSTSQ